MRRSAIEPPWRQRPPVRSTTIIETLKRIPKRGRVSAKEIQSHLERVGIHRDIRSIQRLMNELCSCLPIDQDRRDTTFGYSWSETAKVELSIPGLNDMEALLLLLARDHLASIMPPSVLENLSALFSEAQSQLTSTVNVPESEWRKKVAVSQRVQPLLPPNIPDGVFETVSDCLFANHELSIQYRNRHGRLKDHHLKPLGMVDSSPVIYLVAQPVEPPTETRTFALHRMVSARRLDFQFEWPSDFDLERFVASGKHAYGDGSRVRVTFEILQAAGLHLTEAPLSEDQTVERLQNSYRISATVANSMRLHNFLYGISEDVVGDILIEELPARRPNRRLGSAQRP